MPRDVHGLIRSLFIPASHSYREACWQPSVDIYYGCGGWLVKFDLAGVRPEDIRLTTHGRRLTVSGVRRDLSITEGRHAYSMEISYNRFERSIELPCEVEQLQIESEYRDGMLLITIETEETAR